MKEWGRGLCLGQATQGMVCLVKKGNKKYQVKCLKKLQDVCDSLDKALVKKKQKSRSQDFQLERLKK